MILLCSLLFEKWPFGFRAAGVAFVLLGGFACQSSDPAPMQPSPTSVSGPTQAPFLRRPPGSPPGILPDRLLLRFFQHGNPVYAADILGRFLNLDPNKDNRCYKAAALQLLFALPFAKSLLEQSWQPALQDILDTSDGSAVSAAGGKAIFFERYDHFRKNILAMFFKFQEILQAINAQGGLLVGHAAVTAPVLDQLIAFRSQLVALFDVMTQTEKQLPLWLKMYKTGAMADSSAYLKSVLGFALQDVQPSITHYYGLIPVGWNTLFQQGLVHFCTHMATALCLTAFQKETLIFHVNQKKVPPVRLEAREFFPSLLNPRSYVLQAVNFRPFHGHWSAAGFRLQTFEKSAPFETWVVFDDLREGVSILSQAQFLHYLEKVDATGLWIYRVE